MKIDNLTSQAIRHTKHCLLGCGVGEVMGMAIGQNWHNAAQTALATALAFIFGYGLTFNGAYSEKPDVKRALKIALVADTVSIISMEIIDNGTEWLIPGAMNSKLNQGLFWWSLALALAVAFVITVPVNRYVLSKSKHAHHHH